jgi:glycosyltransferase involved in cell wall biosynthesis
MSDLISVIIPTFNRAALLGRAIHSVMNQSYKNFELIIIDDGSTDQTEELLCEIGTKHNFKYCKKSNKGVAHSRNYGVSLATGQWYAFLDSDDEWHPDKLQKQIQFLKVNPHLKMVYTDEIWIRHEKRVNQKKIHQKHGGNIFEHCLKQCFIAPSSVLIHRELFLEVGGFDESLVVCEDYDLWLRISSAFEIGLLSSPLIVKYGGHEDQLSTKYFAMDKWRILSLQNLLMSKSLTSIQRDLVKQMIVQKGSLLRKGYLKYGHQDEAEALKIVLEKLLV